MPKYNYKDDAMTAYMKGKISAKELDKISKEDFKSSVATKQELQNFLKSGYMKELMANTYGLKVPAMEKKVKELMRFAESMQFEGMFSTIDQIRQDSKDVRDFVKNVFADRDFKKMKNDKDFIKYLKSVYEGFASDAQRRAAFASGYKAKGKKKESISDHPKASWKDKDMDEKLDNDDIPVVKNIITKLKGASKKHAKQADDLEKAVNEISAEGGLKRVIKGQTREVEGIKVSKEMAQAMLDWFNSSPYGRKYPKAKKGRLHISIGIMLSFGLERYAKHKGAKQEIKYLKSISKTLSKKDPRESVNEGNKRYNQKDGVGKSKYVISYHDGKKKHKDGSDFFDIQIFRNKKDLAKFVNTLHKGGYKYGFDESVNEAAIKGQNRKTGETFGMVIGSDKKNKEGNFELTIRVMYSSRISSYKLTFNSNNELINILDYGYSMDGRPPDMKGSGSGKSVKADKRKTIIFIAKLTSPAFANKIYKHLQKVNESVNEGKYYITRNQGRGRGKSLVGGYDLKKKKNLPPKEFRTFKDAEKEVKRLQNTQKGIAGGGSAYFVTDKKMNPLKESINEILVIVDKFDKRKQDYGKVYYQDGGKRPGDGDINKAKKELDKLSKKHKGLTLVSVGRNSKMYDVMDESVNEVSDSEIKKSIKKKERGGPYTIIARNGNRIVAHSPKSYDKVQDAIKMYHKLNKKHGRRSSVSIEDGYGRTVFMESINEASREAMGIAGFTGTRGSAVQKFIDDYNLNSRKLFNFVKKGKLKDRMDFVTAIAGKRGNKFQGKIVGMFGEGKDDGVPQGYNPMVESKTKESKVVQMIYKYEKKEKKFYDKMAEHERRIGPREYGKFIINALRGFGINPREFKRVPDAEEKLYQTVSKK